MNILVCATERTLSEDKLKHLIKDMNADDIITLLSLQELVIYGEQFDFYSDELNSYLDCAFHNIDWSSYHSIVLGCTHFIFYKHIIRKIIPAHIRIIDGNRGTINRLKSLINNPKDVKNYSESACDYYISGRKVPPIYFDHYMRFISESN
jgi:glutamate racemase